MIHRMTETEPQGSVNTTCPSTRTNVRFLQFAGAARTVLYARRQGTGAQRPEESTIIPFSESRYRSSDVGRAHLRRAKPIFYKCALRGYSSLYFASQSRSASTAFVRTKCGTHVLDGDTPYPVIRTKDSAYNGNLWRVPITAQSSTNATDHDALQPLRGSEADCVRSLIRQSIPSRPQHRSKRRAHRARRWGEAPFSINEGRPQRASPASLKDKRRKEYHQTRMVKPFSLNSHRTIYAELPYKLYGNST